MKEWVLVTGSAHRVGYAIAKKFVLQGYNLFLHYNHSKDKAIEAKNEFEKLGATVVLIQADLSDQEEISKILRSVEPYSLKYLVNSAAGFKKQKFMEISNKDFDSVIDVNLKAPFFLSQALVPIISRNEGMDKGAIINISDLSGLHPWKGYSHHGVSKAGLIHLTKVMAFELSPYIRVNVVVPGLILKPEHMLSDNRWSEMTHNIPLKRSGNSNDVAEAVFYLATNKFVNGVILPIDGGENLVGNINHGDA